LTAAIIDVFLRNGFIRTWERSLSILISVNGAVILNEKMNGFSHHGAGTRNSRRDQF
jgi:hypothetical protein